MVNMKKTSANLQMEKVQNSNLSDMTSNLAHGVRETLVTQVDPHRQQVLRTVLIKILSQKIRNLTVVVLILHKALVDLVSSRTTRKGTIGHSH
jgi:hypothetical protein